MDHEHRDVLSIYTRMLEAWNSRDAVAFASLFADHGSCVGFDGSLMNGRHEIATTLPAIFSDHQAATYVACVREIRSLWPGVSLLRSVVGMVPPRAPELNPALNAVQSVIVVADSGQRRIALLQNTPAAFHGRPHLTQQLTAELTEVVRSGAIIAEAG